MSFYNSGNHRLSDGDMDFLVETVSPRIRDKLRLKQILRDDDDFAGAFISDERLFRRVMDDDEVLLRISPTLFFEVLLRRVANDLETMRFTVEKTGTLKIPVFDAKDVVEVLAKDSVIGYLADMLSSFTKIKAYVVSLRIRKGIWKKFRFNDLDIQSLKRICGAVDEAFRFGLYKRIADICLFVLGIFPEYAERDYRYPFSGQIRPSIRGRPRIRPEDYEREGRKFYKMASEHPSAKKLEVSAVLWSLHENFQHARKPLNVIAERYLAQKRLRVFL